MLLSLIVVDDFYANPEEMRAQALRLAYPEPKGTEPYPGRTSRESLLPPETDKLFAQILREPVAGNRAMFHGHLRWSRAADTRNADVHVDPWCNWAGIVYLSRDADSRGQGGTEFFRHKASGADRAPLTDAEARDVFGMPDKSAVYNELIPRDGPHRDRWEPASTIPMKFNRCILFRPWLFHTSGVDFGTDMENGRLVQLLFFRPPNQPDTPRGPKTQGQDRGQAPGSVGGGGRPGP
jgi:hypothetical protein